jgi:hypothetical protein
MKSKTTPQKLLGKHPGVQEFRRRTLLPTMEVYASEKTRHEAWKDHLPLARPGREPSQVAKGALKTARKEFKDFLGSWAPRDQ